MWQTWQYETADRLEVTPEHFKSNSRTCSTDFGVSVPRRPSLRVEELSALVATAWVLELAKLELEERMLRETNVVKYCQTRAA